MFDYYFFANDKKVAKICDVKRTGILNKEIYSYES